MIERVAFPSLSYGNVHNLEKIVEKAGFTIEAIDQSGECESRKTLILIPGVGSFASAMDEFRAKGYDKIIANHVKSGGAVLGICLGMQMLFEKGQEGGETAGLGLIPGSITKLRGQEGKKRKGLSVGWREVFFRSWLEDFTGSYYFVHSYEATGCVEEMVTGSYSRGEDMIVSSVIQGRVCGLQFHPELSGPLGFRLFCTIAECL